jgi:uracil-DNA glycosylase family 4
MHPFRGDLRQRTRHEAPLVRSRVRQGDARAVQHLPPVSDEVEVKGAGRIGNVALASEPAFDGVQRVEGVGWTKVGLHDDDAIQEGRRGGIGPCGRAPPAGARDDVELRVFESHERRFQQGLDGIVRAGEIAAQRDDHRVVEIVNFFRQGADITDYCANEDAEPPRDCPLCPRLVAYRLANRVAHPVWWNGPASSFGDENARLLIVGLAPGRMGANRTGRPFTGDYAGKLLYGTLLKLGFARGTYDERPDDGLELVDCMITNAVRCAPPGNKPETSEENTCRQFLTARIEALPRLKAIITLGDVSRRNVLKALGKKASDGAPGHGSTFDAGPYRVFNSYHCSRLNTNTGRLTTEMFENLFSQAKAYLDPGPPQPPK